MVYDDLSRFVVIVSGNKIGVVWHPYHYDWVPLYSKSGSTNI